MFHTCATRFDRIGNQFSGELNKAMPACACCMHWHCCTSGRHCRDRERRQPQNLRGFGPRPHASRSAPPRPARNDLTAAGPRPALAPCRRITNCCGAPPPAPPPTSVLLAALALAPAGLHCANCLPVQLRTTGSINKGVPEVFFLKALEGFTPLPYRRFYFLILAKLLFFLVLFFLRHTTGIPAGQLFVLVLRILLIPASCLKKKKHKNIQIACITS